MRTLRPLLVVVVTLALAAVCVRLGLWQLARAAEKREREHARLAALAAAPLALADSLPATVRVAGRVVTVRGRYDATVRVLLTGRTHEGAPGVELVTPLRVGGGALLVERGWLPADDGAHPGREPAPDTGLLVVRGVAEPMRRGAGDFAPVPLAGAPGALAARWLDADSLATCLPYPVAAWTLRELPAPDAPPLPVRLAPEAFDPSMHLSYAIQWFCFATAALAAGGFVLTRRPRAGAGGPT